MLLRERERACRLPGGRQSALLLPLYSPYLSVYLPSYPAPSASADAEMGSFLDKPKTDKDTKSFAGNGMVAAMSCMQGWRIEMEVRLPIVTFLPSYSSPPLRSTPN